MQRFHQDMRFGAFTNAEATRIKSHMEDFHTQVQNARASNNGRLTESQRDRGETALKRANQKISQLAHNEDRTVPRQISTQAQNQKEEVRQGVQSGKLTQEEASRIKTLEQKIHTNLQQAKSDGQLTKREIERIDRAQRDAERKIRELEKNDNRVSSPTDQE